MSAIQPISPLNEPMHKAQANAPIGIFDSGVGGLSIAIEIARHLPNENKLELYLIRKKKKNEQNNSGTETR